MRGDGLRVLTVGRNREASGGWRASRLRRGSVNRGARPGPEDGRNRDLPARQHGTGALTRLALGRHVVVPVVRIGQRLPTPRNDHSEPGLWLGHARQSRGAGCRRFGVGRSGPLAANSWGNPWVQRGSARH